MRSAKIKLSLDPTFRTEATWTNPIVPGDHPDPTIVQVGNVYWASATSGEWSPQFPLFRSDDLSRWVPSGAIFPVQPSWAEGAFWAPELVHDEVSNTILAWYVAKRRGGPLCIAVATAPDPAGPYTDHGPLICQEDGSIDPCFARDEHGRPYLIWKEDGNSQGRPTPIWAQALSDDLLKLVGEKTQLITNDQPWEEGIVEGPYILRHEGWFFMFYAGNACCGRECKYAEGVARSERLLGPWEKFAGNPIIGANDNWRCPGHGTAIRSHEQEGRPAQDYFLYHAYPTGGTIYVGREAILDEITWPDPDPQGNPGWPSVNAGRGPSESSPADAIDFEDDFEAPEPGPSWQWPVNTRPDVAAGRGSLTLGIPPESPLPGGPVNSAMLAVPRPAGIHYRASVALRIPARPEPELWAGLAIVGDPFNTVGLGIRGSADDSEQLLILWERRGNTQAVIWQQVAPTVERIHLRATSVGSEHHLQFSFSTDGITWQDAGGLYDATELPAWDRGLRIGLQLEGRCGLSAQFENFKLQAEPTI